jgi:DNA modification methylase
MNKISAIKEKKPKVSYLQYEILEFVWNGSKREAIAEACGYPKNSKIIDSAFKSLKEKGLLDDEDKITSHALLLLEKHYSSRHEHPDYSFSDWDLDETELFESEQEKSFHRWYEYLEDFPAQFVQDSISKYKISNEYFILDPFVGSGTTLIHAKKMGYKGIGFDVNPVMTFIASTKLNWKFDPEEFRRNFKSFVKWFVKNNDGDYLDKTLLSNMPKKELNQWLSPVKQKEISAALYFIDKKVPSDQQAIFRLALLAASIKTSYVAFCPGTTFYPFRDKNDFLYDLHKVAKFVYRDLKTSPKNSQRIPTKVKLTSSKDSKSFRNLSNKVDLIITSPPYPNDLEYTRQTRLEMYILGDAKSMDDVQSIKRSMVKGSTKLIYNADTPREYVLRSKSIQKIAREILLKTSGKSWGFDYPLMIQMYFSDMYECLENYFHCLVTGGTALLVVGDQTIQGVLIPVAEILEEMSKEIGFSEARIELHRERRSSNHDIPIPEENLVLTK